jgi:hypothetical protein
MPDHATEQGFREPLGDAPSGQFRLMSGGPLEDPLEAASEYHSELKGLFHF